MSAQRISQARILEPRKGLGIKHLGAWRNSKEANVSPEGRGGREKAGPSLYSLGPQKMMGIKWDSQYTKTISGLQLHG